MCEAVPYVLVIPDDCGLTYLILNHSLLGLLLFYDDEPYLLASNPVFNFLLPCVGECLVKKHTLRFTEWSFFPLMYLKTVFIFGCAGSLLLHVGFLWLHRSGLGGYFVAAGTGFSLQSTGSLCGGSLVVVRGLSCFRACGPSRIKD